MAKNLFFIGFMGSGKTTISTAFARKYDRTKIEADDIIVERAGMSVKEIFAQQGETAFRDMETELVKEMLDVHDQIISCGGGLVLRPQNVEYMKKSGFVVLLEADPQTILDRVSGSDSRPILNGHMNVEYIAELQAKRRDAYHNAADIVVRTDGKTVDQIVEEVYESINRAGQSQIQ